MSSSLASSTQSSPYHSRNGSSTTLNTINTINTAVTTITTTTTPSTLDSRKSPHSLASPLSALARLRFPSSASSSRRKNKAALAENERRDSDMSSYSDATMVSSQLALSPSETMLATQSMAGSEPRSLTKSLVHRSSRMFLKRKSSKNSVRTISSTFGSDYSATESRRTSIDSTIRPDSKQSMVSYMSRSEQNACRPRISQPYGFQHIAHTAPVQAITALRQVTPSALQSEFSAMQAIQTPTSEIKHIEMDLLRPTTSDGLSSTLESAPATAMSAPSRPLLRSVQSTDSFKRQSKSFSQPFLNGTMTPPRSSSNKRPSRAASKIRVTIPESQDATIKSPVLTRPRTAPSSRSPLRVATSVVKAPSGMDCHAVTTPDDSACVLMDAVTPLDDVPEEEDLVPSPQQQPAAQQSQQSTSVDNADSADGKSSLNRMLRSGSDPVLPESAATAQEEIPQKASRHVSTQSQAGQNWEEEIDYCYEHALESESNADPLSPSSCYLSDADDMVFMKGSDRSSGSSRPIPTLALHLRESSQGEIRNTVLRVPNMLDAPLDSSGNIMFTLSPSMLIPKEYGGQNESLSPSMLVPKDLGLESLSSSTSHLEQPAHSRQNSGKSNKDTNLPFFTPSMGDLNHRSGYSSPRSSATSSNTSTRNSDLTAATAASLSTASIPELVPSGKPRQNRKSGSTSASAVSESEPDTPTLSVYAVSPYSPTKISEAEDDEMQEVDDILSEMPVPPKRTILQQTQRARAKSDSASRAAVQSSRISVAKPVHARSASSAVAAASTATTTSIAAPAPAAAASATSSASASSSPQRAHKPTYSLFPPLDRIGAAPPARA